jgi:hypothetical protein
LRRDLHRKVPKPLVAVIQRVARHVGVDAARAQRQVQREITNSPLARPTSNAFT